MSALQHGVQSMSSSRQESTNTSALMQEPVQSTSSESAPTTVAPDLSIAPSVFSQASRVVVEGANTFSNAGGSVFHINSLNLPVTIDSPFQVSRAANMFERDAQTVSSSLSPANPSKTSTSSFLHVKPSLEPRHESEVYARLLLPKKHGYPLWYPQPRSTLPSEYLERGLSIGDVGLITAEGGFDFRSTYAFQPTIPSMVISFRRSSAPSEASMSPEIWTLIRLLGSLEVTSQMGLSASEFNDKYSFECFSADGAVLTLPEGALRANLLSLNDFFKYAGQNAYHWYKFVNGPRGRQAANGSLYLVTGYDKTRSWGTASFASVVGPGTFDLTFNAANARSTRRPDFAYVWSRSGLATTMEGPLLEQNDARQERPQNQCTFIRGFRVALGETLWSLLVHSVDVMPITEQNPTTFFRKSSFVPFSLNNVGWAKLLGLSLNLISSTGTGSSKEQSKQVLIKSDIPVPNTNLHPSTVINRHILGKFPDVDVAITHDDIWCSAIYEGEDTLPDGKQLLQRVYRHYDLVNYNGVHTFQGTGSRYSTHTRPTPAKDVVTFDLMNHLKARIAQERLPLRNNIHKLIKSGNLDSVDAKGRTALSLAAEGGFELIAKSLLCTSGIDVDPPTANGRTPLSLASEKGYSSIVRRLLEEPEVNPNSRDNRGWTPLAFAAYNGHRDVTCLLLLQKRASADLPNHSFRTPLMHAAKRGHPLVVELLLKFGKTGPDLEDVGGATALSLAATYGHVGVVELLLAAGSDPNHQDFDGNTPLLLAATNGHTSVAKTLLDTRRVDPDVKNVAHQSPLLLASKGGFGGVVDLLLQFTRNPDSRDYDNRTPLSYAAEQGRVHIVTSLLRTDGVNPDLANRWNGWTPLFYAVNAGGHAVVERLLKSGVDADRQDFLDRTPLTLAAEKGYGKIVEMLMHQRNIRIHSTDRWGRMALSYATQEGHAAVVAMLLNKPTRSQPPRMLLT